ncbi:hypothetical protein [Merismopedia glauca]|uniref:Recombinase family protein n=1 Tax=Merismopedia glauca CCAP 1448/3 TaxID=1296344 RepID=A0A2T1C545_9CYAN|nr:hypothetical protein [Merismopedia glauca]PSB03402.1 hypothetical protein C7B64_08680 [Merismopedia glauca CCAP 1448/3]
MLSDSVWVNGGSRTGKTTRLLMAFGEWMQNTPGKKKSKRQIPGVLLMAANEERRRHFADRLATAYQGKYPVVVKTPLGFFEDEVRLYWPLLIESLAFPAQFPLRLRPETEQDCATRLWRDDLELGKLQEMGVNEYRGVRRLLDLLQLAGCSGVEISQISTVLEAGFAVEESDKQIAPADWKWAEKLLVKWQNWCLERGLLTYGLICDLYAHNLLPNPVYQQQLRDRYSAILADDVDEYPGITKDLFDRLLDFGCIGAFTYNIDGAVRLGLNADPDYLHELSQRCRIENLAADSPDSLLESLGESILEIVTDPSAFTNLPVAVSSIQTTSRGELLRQTVQVISEAIQRDIISPAEIAIITPGLDAIARYTLTELLNSAGILVESVSDRRPLISYPAIRALLTLLALVYPGLGRLVEKDAVAEMLVVLSNRVQDTADQTNTPEIDSVRAGLIVDSCYCPDFELPKLLPVTAFPRWDRLGYRATTAYERILKWIEEQQQQHQMHLIPSFVALLDRAIQEFLWNGSHLPYEQLAALRGLMETAQHYWEVNKRLATDTPLHTVIARLIVLLEQGTITANPYPISYLEPNRRAITLATIFQYRSRQNSHKWQFWLDAGSSLWLSGGAATLFGAPLFLQDNLKQPGNAILTDTQTTDEARLKRILRDLLARTDERVYLCHSELATNGQEQIGPLLSLVNAAMPLTNPVYLQETM